MRIMESILRLIRMKRQIDRGRLTAAKTLQDVDYLKTFNGEKEWILCRDNPPDTCIDKKDE